MQLDDTLFSGDACRAVGISFANLDVFLKRGFVRLAKPSRGTGHRRAYTIRQLWTIAVVRSLQVDNRQRDDVLRRVAATLESLSNEQLSEAMNNGRRFVFVVDDHPHPDLVGPDVTLPVGARLGFLVDVAETFHRIYAAVQRLKNAGAH